jgi:ApbE superfamily uncharacterized protein (UPF0280 family)
LFVQHRRLDTVGEDSAMLAEESFAAVVADSSTLVADSEAVADSAATWAAVADENPSLRRVSNAIAHAQLIGHLLGP